MKSLGIAFTFSVIFASFSIYVGCDKHPVTTPMPPPTATPTSTPIRVTIDETNSGFNPAAVTISAGSEVIWTYSGTSFSSILMDQFGPTNGCTNPAKILNPGQAVTYQFNSAPLTIDFQDTFQSPNGGAPCAPQASSFSGEVFVQ